METKLKYKVGDKVRVKSLEWYNENKNFEGNVYTEENTGIYFSEFMSNLCGKIVQIEKVNGDYSYYVNGSSLFWQDWMFEPVTEEKQEDIQEEKKEEKRNKIVEASLQPITKEEAKKLLIGTKFFCTDYAETDRLQKKLFECGCEWSDIGKKINIERWAIYVNAGGILTHDNKAVLVWCEDKNVPILIDDVLAIKIKEEWPKFDPKSLRPFDKVLVKNDTIWFARFFDMCREGRYQTTSGEVWIYCIPYNEETRHLHGNANKAPEYYRI